MYNVNYMFVFKCECVCVFKYIFYEARSENGKATYIRLSMGRVLNLDSLTRPACNVLPKYKNVYFRVLDVLE